MYNFIYDHANIIEHLYVDMLLLIIILTTECYGKKLPLRVLGGADANEDLYPYVVRIEIQHTANFSANNTVIAKHDHLCTASALTATWALTAAHCLNELNYFYIGVPYTMERLVIRYGHVHHSPWEHDSFSDILQSILHPSFTYVYDGQNSNGIMKHDIGLMKTTPMEIPVFLKISAVDFYSLYGQEAIFAGFGITHSKVEGKTKVDNTLALKKPLQIMNVLMSKCLRDDLLAPAICLGARCGDKATTCSGDTGGPLVHRSGIVGILSISDLTGYCYDRSVKAVGNVAGIVAPLSPYIEWIHAHITAEK